MRIGQLFCLFFGFSLVSAAASPLPPFYLSNRQGEVEPCGCSTDQQGGLHRLYNALEQHAGKSPRLVVDAGDTFYSLRRLPEHRKAQESLQAKLIAKAYAKMKVDVFTPGERDFAEGKAALLSLIQTSGVRPVSVNLYEKGKGRAFAPYVVVERSGWKAVVVGVSYFSPTFENSDYEARPWEAELKSIWEKVRAEQADVVVLASQLGLATDKELAEKFPFDFIVGARTLEALTAPDQVKQTRLVQPQIRGQWVGLFTLKKGEAPEHKTIELTKAYEAPSNEILLLMLEQKKEVRALALNDSKKNSLKLSKEPFVGHAETCRVCHAKQTEFWESTKHASAYLVLYAKNQHFDPECISCHSLGFQSSQGFQKIASPIEWEDKRKVAKGKNPWVEQLMEKTFEGDKAGPLDSREQPDRYAVLKKRYHASLAEWEATGKLKRVLIGVQCEHCHGNRNGHPGGKSPTLKKVSEVTCQGCHTPPHAKPFEPSMFVKASCPLSGH